MPQISVSHVRVRGVEMTMLRMPVSVRPRRRSMRAFDENLIGRPTAIAGALDLVAAFTGAGRAQRIRDMASANPAGRNHTIV